MGDGDGHPPLPPPPEDPPPSEDESVGVLEDGDVDDIDVGEALRDIREDLRPDDADEDTYFYMRILGGEWTYHETGEVVDAALGTARGGLATAFARAYGFPPSRRWNFTTYGAANARMLAREFVRRGICFVRSTWQRMRATPLFAFSQDMVDSYAETAEYLDWAIALDVHDPVFDQVVALRRVAPDVG